MQLRHYPVCYAGIFILLYMALSSSFASAAGSLPSIATKTPTHFHSTTTYSQPTALVALVKRDDGHDDKTKDADDDKKKHNDGDKTKITSPTEAKKRTSIVRTESDHGGGSTVVESVTTIIIITSDSPDQVYHDMGDNGTYARQREPSSESPISDPNQERDQQRLETDQHNLHTLLVVASTIGGTCAVAVMVTLILVIRKRSLKRQNQKDDIEPSGNENAHGPSGYELTTYPSNRVGPGGHAGVPNTFYGPNEADMPHLSTLPMPSAPPAPSELIGTISPFDDQHAVAVSNYGSHSIHSPIVPDDTIVTPSAPSAKEFTDVQETRMNCGESSSAAGVSPRSPCPHCDMHSPQFTDLPNVPPPAYTPSAPPFYALPLPSQQQSFDERHH
ncbi:uncharacterized protein BYT42DRAFT_393313 [Radiomyces spectabilis]|uniref:uncharacterized protein n=1 Tax=Radiomyces spectabilis TaxID=64574 RepID=UPI00221F8E71|nr:uncharacterized protein BYT42DRAFT_393313 [Radiomyces spectabilis]KAI8374170.1 hypothetical protein BYT42DRAFT_393313 [Radiomyces spectabilis]